MSPNSWFDKLPRSDLRFFKKKFIPLFFFLSFQTCFTRGHLRVIRLSLRSSLWHYRLKWSYRISPCEEHWVSPQPYKISQIEKPGDYLRKLQNCHWWETWTRHFTNKRKKKSVSAFKPFLFSSAGVKANLSSTPASQTPRCPCESILSLASQSDHHLRERKWQPYLPKQRWRKSYFLLENPLGLKSTSNKGSMWNKEKTIF